MARKCELCGKGTISGNNVPRKGVAKKKGGFRRFVVNRTKRVFKPNIVKVKTIIKGSVKTVKVCTRCLKAGKVVKVI